MSKLYSLIVRQLNQRILWAFTLWTIVIKICMISSIPKWTSESTHQLNNTCFGFKLCCYFVQFWLRLRNSTEKDGDIGSRRITGLKYSTLSSECGVFTARIILARGTLHPKLCWSCLLPFHCWKRSSTWKFSNPLATLLQWSSALCLIYAISLHSLSFWSHSSRCFSMWLREINRQSTLNWLGTSVTGSLSSDCPSETSTSHYWSLPSSPKLTFSSGQSGCLWYCLPLWFSLTSSLPKWATHTRESEKTLTRTFTRREPSWFRKLKNCSQRNTGWKTSRCSRNTSSLDNSKKPDQVITKLN